MPTRIQRKRSKGWRMPEGAWYVGRPSRWGNPFDINTVGGRDIAIRLYRDMVQGIWDPRATATMSDDKVSMLYEAHRKWLSKLGWRSPREAARVLLRGKDLACWCPLCDRHRSGKPLLEQCPDCTPCHVDPLGELANS